MGRRVFAVTEKLTSLDFFHPTQTVPFFLQGPFCHVPCQIATLERHTDGSGAVFLTCSRGYAGDMVTAILAAGAPLGLRCAGENRLRSLGHQQP
jgi:hypothetical protein